MAGRSIPKPQAWRREVASGVAEVVPDDRRPHAAELFVNGAPQSHVDLAEPEYLLYEYVQHIAAVLDSAFVPQAPIAALHLGGGALTLPRYLAATRPRSRQRVVELDGDLVTFVREALPLPRRAGIKVTAADARQTLEQVRPESYHAVVVDTYTGPRMPAELASQEALTLAQRAVRPGGVLAVNLADGKPLTFARAMVATALTVFRPLAVIADAAVWRGRRFGNLVLVGGLAADVRDALSRRLAGGPCPARLATGAALARFASGAPVVTDATATPSPQPPVDTFG